MITKHYILSFLTLCLSGFLTAQTGPGGVGSSSTNIGWFRSDVGVTNSGGVQQWADQSGNGFTLNQSAAGNRPSLANNQINGFPAIIFDGNNDFIEGSIGGSNMSTVSVFVVGNYNQANQPNNDHDFFYSIGSAWNTSLNHGRAAGNFNGGADADKYYAWVSGVIRLGASTTLNSSYNIHSQRFNSTAPFHNFNLGGTSQTVQDVSSAINVSRNLRLGALKNGAITHPLNGSIAEIIVFNAFTNTTQTTIIENYLAAKYNLTISNDLYSHQGTHPNEVAGIGQTSSTDNHTDSKGSAIVRITGADDLEDGEFLFWGHDNGTLSADGAEIPPGFGGNGSKLDMEWVSDATGGDGVGLVDITFDMSAFSLGADPSFYRILTDPDGNFGDGNVSDNSSIAPSAIGSLITFNNVDLSTNNFFTIAHKDSIQECTSVDDLDWEFGDPTFIWDCLVTPDSTKDVIIGDGTNVTVTGDVTCNSLNITASASLTLAAGSSIAIKSDAVIKGTLICADGSRVICRGNGGGQTIDYTNGATLTFDDLVINNPNNVRFIGSGAYAIAGGLYLMDGELQNTATLTFTSDINSTGHIARKTVTSKMTGGGTYNVERFLDLRAADWNTIASSGVQTTIEDLDGEIFTSGFPGTDGFAQQSGGGSFVSFLGWDNSADDYVVPASTADSFAIGSGYECWLGDNLTSWNGSSWSLSGDIKTGAASIPVDGSGGGWNLLGNPYPSFLDFTNINANHSPIAGNEFWYYSANDAAYMSLGTGNLIPPGHGFWIQWSGGASTINLDMTTGDIVNTTSTSAFFKVAQDHEEFKVHVQKNGTRLGSAVFLRKDLMGYSGKDENDTPPLRLPQPDAPFIVMEAGADDLMVNYLSAEEDHLEIPLRFEPGSEGKFTLDFAGFDKFSEYQCVNLINESNGDQIALSEDATYEIQSSPSAETIHMKLIMSKADYVDCISPNSFDADMVNVIAVDKQIFADFYLDRSASADIVIYNVLGEPMHQSKTIVGYSRESINFSDKAAGIYFVNITINGTTTTDKVILK